MLRSGTLPVKRQKPCQTKVWRSQKRPANLKVGVPRHSPGLPRETGRQEADSTSFLQSFLCVLCVLCALCANPVFQDTYKAYRAVAKRRGAYAAMLR